MARRPEKLVEFAKRGAQIVRGSLDDPDYVTWMTHGVDVLFWITPPGYGSDDIRAYQNRMGRAAAEAISINRIPRIVNLSSVGAHLSAGVGPINGLHDIEQLLNESSKNVLHLRPGFFFENYIWQTDALREKSSVFMPISGTRCYPMIATADIGRVAVDWVMDTTWTGRWVQELHGPADMTFDQAAAALSEGLGRTITHIKIEPEQAHESMLQHGMSGNAADSMLELYDAIETQRLKPIEARSSRNTTPTTLAKFAHDVLSPLLEEAPVR